MAQTIEEQVNTIERALGERMITHGLAIVRTWMNELGEDNAFEADYISLFTRYQQLFSDWMASNDEVFEEPLDELTGLAYRLADEVYAALRLQRGLSPTLHGFNPDNPQSVMQYFSSCLTISASDYAWMSEVLNDPDRASMALLSVAGLAKNLRECFSDAAMIQLIEGMQASNAIVAEQCLANIMILLVHYDVRIDFFPLVQESFTYAIGDGEQAFETLCAIVHSLNTDWIEMYRSGECTLRDMPEEVRHLIELTGADKEMTGVEQWLPTSEKEYLAGIVQILPDTWLFSELVHDNPERQRTMEILYLLNGSMDLMWDKTDLAESILVQHIRNHKTHNVKDFINYGHCLLLRGDRMMAFESYREARKMCQNSKEFFALFRPDRRPLVDHGAPMEQVYLIEDQLLSV